MIYVLSGKSKTEIFATIHVEYPEGLPCTCSDGVTTLSAPDTSGEFIFLVPNEGTWTVSCIDGESVYEKSVTITEQYQYESLQIVPILYLVKNGDLVGTWTRGNRGYNEDVGDSIRFYIDTSSSSACGVTGWNGIDISNYAGLGFTKLYVDGYCTTSNKWNLYSYVGVESADGGGHQASLTLGRNRDIMILDLSDIDLSICSCVTVHTGCSCADTRGSSSAYIYNMYLE